MITQTEIILNKIPPLKGRNEPAVKIHGFLMKIIPEQIIQSYHDIKSIRPYSIYLLRENHKYDILKINTLTSESEVIIDRLKDYHCIYFEDIKKEVEIISIKTVRQLTYEELYNYPIKKEYTISILTPATYKIENCYSNWFHLGRLINSVIMKNNQFGEHYINKELYQDIDQNINILDYKLVSSQYQIMNRKIKALKGSIKIEIKNNSENLIIGSLMEYINFTGLGAKTAMGMGGTVVAD